MEKHVLNFITIISELNNISQLEIFLLGMATTDNIDRITKWYWISIGFKYKGRLKTNLRNAFTIFYINIWAWKIWLLVACRICSLWILINFSITIKCFPQIWLHRLFRILITKILASVIASFLEEYCNYYIDGWKKLAFQFKKIVLTWKWLFKKIKLIWPKNYIFYIRLPSDLAK